MSTVLLQKIQGLPKEIQNIIYEYNVDHREQLNKCFKEYFKTIFMDCKICSNNVINPNNYYYVDYFVNSKCNISSYWCNDFCFFKDTDEKYKEQYKTSVQNYFMLNSIQHKGEIIDFS